VPFEFSANVGAPPVVLTVTGALKVTVIGITVPVVPVVAVEDTSVTVGDAPMTIFCAAKPSLVLPAAGKVSVALVVGVAVSTMLLPLGRFTAVEV